KFRGRPVPALPRVSISLGVLSSGHWNGAQRRPFCLRRCLEQLHYFREWVSPDGVFGVALLSSTGHSITVQLSVANPLPALFTENATLNPILNGTQAPKTVAYLGVTFSLQGLGWGGPGGPTLNATATMPNGTTYPLSMWDGSLYACGATNGVPSWVPDHATCLAHGSPDHDVAILWDGNLNVTLMVRSG